MKRSNPKSDHLVRSDIMKAIAIAIKNADYPSKKELRALLPDRIQDATLNQALQSLEQSNKIMFHNDGSIVWIHSDNKRLRKLLSTSTRL